MKPRTVVALAAVVLVVAGCAAPTANDAVSLSVAPSSNDSSSSAAATTISAPATTTAPTTEAPPPPTTEPPAPAPTPEPGAGKVVVIDPGHNGANGANPQIINQPVPDGTGGTKPCNTTGTATNAGYPEHAFTWDVGVKVKALLEAAGVQVVLTRPDDQGVGPCVDKRAEIGNAANADAVVSIHGDGAAAGSHGFFCMTSALQPAGAAVDAQSLVLAGTVRDGVVATGAEPTANYFGTDGLGPRSDLAGLNLSKVPTTMCELGNMRSSVDAAIMSGADGRSTLAQGIATGILTYLGTS